MAYLNTNSINTKQKIEDTTSEPSNTKGTAIPAPSKLGGDKSVVIHGEPSLPLANSDVQLFVTPRAGQMAPVRFRIGKRWVQPYALAPWQPHEISENLPPILRVLRGDYFCLPFGSSAGIKDVHGETANAHWDLVSEGPGRLVMEMDVNAPKCHVRKTLSIKSGHRAVYQEHLIEGLQGRYNLGHHAILLFPDKGGPYHVNTSPFHFGSVKPDAFSDPLAREYGTLKTGGHFTSLAKVPLAQGGYTSLQRYPARQGFEDLVMMTSKPGDFAWTAATLDGYVWISLKDPRTLPSTLFWLSNGGRHGYPWNGNHQRRLGLEEVCGHFSDGLETSRKNLLKADGVPTTLAFKAKEAKSIRLIHLVHPVPQKFGMVESVERGKQDSEIRVIGSGGRTIKVPVDWGFLHG
jgi:hypothetical protein